jgi:hypothetical protein
VASDSREYQGPKGACSMCERHFKIGELILVDSAGDLLFCAQDISCDANGKLTIIPCCVLWACENNQGCNLTVVFFRGKS